MSDNSLFSSPALISMTGIDQLDVPTFHLPPSNNKKEIQSASKPTSSTTEYAGTNINKLSSQSVHSDGEADILAANRWTTGRAPWYDEHGNRSAPIVIGVTGGSASGKTSVCNAIVEKLNLPWVQMLSMDRFYKGLTEEDDEAAHAGLYNFDHPSAFDFDQFVKTIKEIRTGKVVEIPIYDFATHARLPKTDRLYGADVIIVEGILVLYDERVRKLLDLKIYVDTDSDLRLARRIDRDVRERGRTVAGVLSQYMATVKPSFEQYISPTKRYADLIIPWNETNHKAVDLISQHIASILDNRGIEHILRNKQRGKTQLLRPSEVPKNIKIMDRTPVLVSLHTSVRNNATEQDDWIHNLQRLVYLCTSYVIDFLEHEYIDVVTPTGSTFCGTQLACGVAAVSIIRTGEIFEPVLSQLLPDASQGKIAIQQPNNHKLEIGPRLYYANIPHDICENRKKVLLFDGVLATGGAVNMAIQVLLDHGVYEEDIIFCCLVAAPEGLYNLTTNFPHIQIISSWIDDGLDSHGFCSPGIGYLGDRYFGTSTKKNI